MFAVLPTGIFFFFFPLQSRNVSQNWILNLCMFLVSHPDFEFILIPMNSSLLFYLVCSTPGSFLSCWRESVPSFSPFPPPPHFLLPSLPSYLSFLPHPSFHSSSTLFFFLLPHPVSVFLSVSLLLLLSGKVLLCCPVCSSAPGHWWSPCPSWDCSTRSSLTGRSGSHYS